MFCDPEPQPARTVVFKKLCLLIALLCLAACAPRSSQTNDPAAPPVLSPDQQMANFLGDSHPGASASFSGTSYGDYVTVTTREDYISALGELCREGLVNSSGGITRIAVCRDKKEQAWRLAPRIFPQGAL